MRKLLSLIILGIFLCACSEDFENSIIKTDVKPKASNYSIVYIKDGKIITSDSRSGNDSTSSAAFSFPDEESFGAFVDSLGGVIGGGIPLDSTILVEYDIITLHSLVEEFDQKLDSICNICMDDADFSVKYEALKAQYTDRLIENNVWENDLNLYVSGGDENPINYVANSNGQYVINGEIITTTPSAYICLADYYRSLMHVDMDNFHDDYLINDDTNPIIGDNPETGHPNFWEMKGTPCLNCWGFYPKKGHRMQLSIDRNKNGVIKLYFKAKHRTWLGKWKNDRNRHFQYYLTYNTGTTGRLQWYPNYSGYHYRISSSGIVGDVAFLPQSEWDTVEGYIYFWTDLTAEKDENNQLLFEFINGNKFMIVDETKSPNVHYKL